MPLDNLSELKRRVPGGKYTLARAIAERARQLQTGQVTPLVEVRTPNPLSVAIDEIVQAKISFRFGDDVKTDDEGEEVAAAGEEILPVPSDEAPVKVKKERAPRKTAAAKEKEAAAEAEAPKDLTIEVDAPADEAASDEAPAESV